MLVREFRPIMFLFTILCGFMPEVVSPSFDGQILPNPQVPAAALPASLHVFLITGRQVLGHADPDSTGRFAMNLSSAPDAGCDIFCVAPGLDTLFLGSIKINALPSSPTRLLFPCEPDTTASGDIVCPKCRKDDQVYPIVYGDPIAITRHVDTAGKLSWEKTNKKADQTDLRIKAARYYCRRDKINF